MLSMGDAILMQVKTLKLITIYFIIGVVWFVGPELIYVTFLKERDMSYVIRIVQALFFVVGSSALLWYLYRAKLQFQSSENRYRNLIDLSPDPIIVHKNGKLIYVNNAAVKIVSAHSSDELIGRSIFDFVHPDYLDVVTEWGRELRETGKPSEILQEKLVRLDGESIDVEVRSVPTVYMGEIIFQNLFRDITGQKRAEEALADSEVKYRSIVEDSFVGIFIFRKGRFTYVNPRCSEIFGYTEEELLKIDVVNLFTDKVSPFVEESIIDMPSHEIERFHFQAKGRTKDQLEIDIEGHARAIFINGVPALIGSIQNVTERIKTQELVQKAEKLSVVGQLAAGLAHEIRNPLTSIKGFIQLISEQQQNVEYCAIVLSELDRINEIVSEFLMIAKPQTEGFKLNELNELIQKIVSLINVQAIMNNVQITLDLEPDIPQIFCNENQIKQLLLNVLKNAIEASPAGSQIKVQLKMKDKNNVWICVIDYGCGIPKELLPKLGEPFYTTKGKGTGLGLMVSYKIVEIHKGHISINSEEDKGTTVDIVLPIKN
jgi:PAS domain S-box-containing protein